MAARRRRVRRLDRSMTTRRATWLPNSAACGRCAGRNASAGRRSPGRARSRCWSRVLRYKRVAHQDRRRFERERVGAREAGAELAGAIGPGDLQALDVRRGRSAPAASDDCRPDRRRRIPIAAVVVVGLTPRRRGGSRRTSRAPASRSAQEAWRRASSCHESQPISRRSAVTTAVLVFDDEAPSHLAHCASGDLPRTLLLMLPCIAASAAACR